MRLVVVFPLIAFWFASSANASLHFDLSGFVGYSGTTVTSGSAPTLIQGGGGGTLGYKLGSFFVGGTSDFRLINQYSEVTEAVGNRRGTRWNLVSPTLGAAFGSFLIKLDYQFLGDYKLGNRTSDGQELVYQGPSGFRGSIHYAYSSIAYLGAFYETVSFGRQSLGGATSELASPLTLWQVGATLTLKLSGLWESEFDFDY